MGQIDDLKSQDTALQDLYNKTHAKNHPQAFGPASDSSAIKKYSQSTGDDLKVAEEVMNRVAGKLSLPESDRFKADGKIDQHEKDLIKKLKEAANKTDGQKFKINGQVDEDFVLYLKGKVGEELTTVVGQERDRKSNVEAVTRLNEWSTGLQQYAKAYPEVKAEFPKPFSSDAIVSANDLEVREKQLKGIFDALKAAPDARSEAARRQNETDRPIREAAIKTEREEAARLGAAKALEQQVELQRKVLPNFDFGKSIDLTKPPTQADIDARTELLKSKQGAFVSALHLVNANDIVKHTRNDKELAEAVSALSSFEKALNRDRKSATVETTKQERKDSDKEVKGLLKNTEGGKQHDAMVHEIGETVARIRNSLRAGYGDDSRLSDSERSYYSSVAGVTHEVTWIKADAKHKTDAVKFTVDAESAKLLDKLKSSYFYGQVNGEMREIRFDKGTGTPPSVNATFVDVPSGWDRIAHRGKKPIDLMSVSIPLDLTTQEGKNALRRLVVDAHDGSLNEALSAKTKELRGKATTEEAETSKPAAKPPAPTYDAKVGNQSFHGTAKELTNLEKRISDFTTATKTTVSAAQDGSLTFKGADGKPVVVHGDALRVDPNSDQSLKALYARLGRSDLKTDVLSQSVPPPAPATYDAKIGNQSFHGTAKELTNLQKSIGDFTTATKTTVSASQDGTLTFSGAGGKPVVIQGGALRVDPNNDQSLKALYARLGRSELQASVLSQSVPPPAPTPAPTPTYDATVGNQSFHGTAKELTNLEKSLRDFTTATKTTVSASQDGTLTFKGAGGKDIAVQGDALRVDPNSDQALKALYARLGRPELQADILNKSVPPLPPTYDVKVVRNAGGERTFHGTAKSLTNLPESIAAFEAVTQSTVAATDDGVLIIRGKSGKDITVLGEALRVNPNSEDAMKALLARLGDTKLREDVLKQSVPPVIQTHAAVEEPLSAPTQLPAPKAVTIVDYRVQLAKNTYGTIKLPSDIAAGFDKIKADAEKATPGSGRMVFDIKANSVEFKGSKVELTKAGRSWAVVLKELQDLDF